MDNPIRRRVVGTLLAGVLLTGGLAATAVPTATATSGASQAAADGCQEERRNHAVARKNAAQATAAYQDARDREAVAKRRYERDPTKANGRRYKARQVETARAVERRDQAREQRKAQRRILERCMARG